MEFGRLEEGRGQPPDQGGFGCGQNCGRAEHDWAVWPLSAERPGVY